MRPGRSLAALLAVSLAAGAVSGAGPPLTARLPRGLPSDEILAGWEQVIGEVERDGSRVAYRLFVEPTRPGLYRVTQYRITPAARGASDGVAETEKLLWNAEPGRRVPLHCYERVRQRGWHTLWLWKTWRWRLLEPGSAAYRAEMLTAIRVYQLHRERLGLAPPADR